MPRNCAKTGIRIYEAEKIVSHRIDETGLKFKIRWVGFSENADTWEIALKVMDACQKSLSDYFLTVPKETQLAIAIGMRKSILKYDIDTFRTEERVRLLHELCVTHKL